MTRPTIIVAPSGGYQQCNHCLDMADLTIRIGPRRGGLLIHLCFRDTKTIINGINHILHPAGLE